MPEAQQAANIPSPPASPQANQIAALAQTITPPPPDPRPNIPNLPTLDMSAIRKNPKQGNCQQYALEDEARLKDEGYANTRLLMGYVKNPPADMPLVDRNHLMVAFQREAGGPTWVLDSRAGHDAMLMSDLAPYYTWMFQEK